jgi:thiol-disulfide isomerase/thioredoxin
VTTGQTIFVVVVLGALAFGLWRAVVDGRFRGTHQVRGAAEPAPDPVLPPVVIGNDIELGDRATLLQFSTAFCAPCRATRRVLADVAAVVPGVTHIEIDAEHHLALVRELNILRTPTTLVLDSAGREVSRAAGAPRKQDVLAALADAIS